MTPCGCVVWKYVVGGIRAGEDPVLSPSLMVVVVNDGGCIIYLESSENM